MTQSGRTITREIGAALAVLGLYVFMLLVPLHQAAGLQRDLANLGFETASEWSVCTPLAIDADGNPLDGQPQCGLAALAKAGLDIPPQSPDLDPPDRVENTLWAAAHVPARGEVRHRLHHPRAPPVAV